MADRIVYGMTVGIRDVPVKGMQVRLDAGAPYGGLMLEPREAAQLGAELIAQAQEAIHASRASRRVDNHRCPACRMGLATHDERDPQCEARRLPPMCDYRWLPPGAPGVVNHVCLRDQGHSDLHLCNCGAMT